MATRKTATETAVLMNAGVEIDRETVTYVICEEFPADAFGRAADALEVRRGGYRWNDTVHAA